MEEYLSDTIEYKGQNIKIYQDTDPQDPREWDNIGNMLCFHGRYNLGDKSEFKAGDFGGWEEVKEYLLKEKKAKVIAPLYLYDHSGLRIKIGSFAGLLSQGHAEFDSGQVGFIYATDESIKKEYNIKRITKNIKEKVMKVLEAEVDIYDKYISGEVYGFKAETEKGEAIDSCWGFYSEEDAVGEAKGAIDYYINDRIKKHNNKLKGQIKGKVNINHREPLKI